MFRVLSDEGFMAGRVALSGRRFGTRAEQAQHRPSPYGQSGYGEVGVYGGGILRGAPTPRIDKPASEGLRLLNFNVEAQCTPRRAALVIGRYAIRTGNASPPRPRLLKNTCFWASKCRL